jgi:hypothetical protein
LKVLQAVIERILVPVMNEKAARDRPVSSFPDNAGAIPPLAVLALDLHMAVADAR